MDRNDHLAPRHGAAPLLVAARLTNKFEPMLFEESNYLISGEPGDSALTQS